MGSNAYSMDIVKAIRTILDKDEWHYNFDSDDGVIKFGLKLSTKLKRLDYVIRIRDDNYTVYAVSPLNADESDAEMMARMAEFVCRANYGLKNGNFEFDFRDGEIRYKSHVDCEDMLPGEETIRNSISIPHGMFKRYSPGIVDIVFGDTSAEDAVERCEKPQSEVRQSLLSDSAQSGQKTTGTTEDTDELLRRLSELLGSSGD